jgi:hypothetical protein
MPLPRIPSFPPVLYNPRTPREAGTGSRGSVSLKVEDIAPMLAACTLRPGVLHNPNHFGFPLTQILQ